MVQGCFNGSKFVWNCLFMGEYGAGWNTDRGHFVQMNNGTIFVLYTGILFHCEKITARLDWNVHVKPGDCSQEETCLAECSIGRRDFSWPKAKEQTRKKYHNFFGFAAKTHYSVRHFSYSGKSFDPIIRFAPIRHFSLFLLSFAVCCTSSGFWGLELM